jgi:hypothetical protein
LSVDSLETTTALFVPAANPAARATLGRLALAGLQPGKLGALTLEQVTVTGPEGVGRLASLEIADLTYGAAGAPVAVGRLRLGELTVGLKAGAEVSVKEALVAMERSADQPAGATIKLSAVTIPATAMPMLMLAGYNELTLDYEGSSRYDPARAAVGATQLLSARDAGSFSLSMQLGNYPAAFDWRESFTVMLKFMALRLDSLELRYDDASLVDRLIRARAALTGRDVRAVREEMLRLVAAQRQALADKPALLASLDAIADFLRKPGSLTMTLTPPEPVALGTLITLSRTNPAAALDALGLSVR